MREDMILSGARPRTQQQQHDVFHFPQFSNISSADQTKETYSVDRNFIRDLEKSLGDNESKKVIFRSDAFN